jgi:hypothetical protein
MSFIVARLKSGHTPETRELNVAAGAAFSQGALLLKDANGDWAECGADPASIAAVALSDYGADTGGYGSHGTKEFPPGRMQATLVADEQPFHAEYVGTLPAADGGSYGVVRDADGRWKVDFAETVNTRVKLVNRYTNSPENRNRVEVKFLAANVQVV